MDGWASKRESWLKRRGVARSPPPLPLNARIPHIIPPPACLPWFYPLSLSPPSLVLTFFASLSSPSAPLPLPQVQHHQIVNYHSFILCLPPFQAHLLLFYPDFFPNLLALPPYRSPPPPPPLVSCPTFIWRPWPWPCSPDGRGCSTNWPVLPPVPSYSSLCHISTLFVTYHVVISVSMEKCQVLDQVPDYQLCSREALFCPGGDTEAISIII